MGARAHVLRVAVVGLLALTAGLPSVPAAMAAVPAADRDVVVPVVTVDAPASRGRNGIVEVRLGDRAPIRVMLDTGSVGLRVFPGGWDGPVADGLASAPFTIGGVRSVDRLTFQVAASTNPFLDAWAAQGVVGILGVGMGRSPLVNPLTTLPGDLGRRWSVHLDRRSGDDSTRVGRLVLGAVVPADAQATFRVPSAGTSSAGVPLWADHRAQACWSFGTARPVCADTWFDSGFHLLRVAGRPFAGIPTVRGSGRVDVGTVVRMGAVGAAFTPWRVVAGREPSRNAVVLFSRRGDAAVNTGNAVYFDHTLTYDVDRGLIALS